MLILVFEKDSYPMKGSNRIEISMFEMLNAHAHAHKKEQQGMEKK